MFLSNHCWMHNFIANYKVIKLSFIHYIQSSNCKLQSHQVIIYTLYKVIKLQITKSSSYHLYIIFSHQVANYKVIKLSFIHYTKSSNCKLSSHQIIIYTLYKIIKLQIIKSSNYHYFIQYHEYFCQWLLSIFLLCLVLENFSIQSFIIKYKQNTYFEAERYDVSAIIDKEKLCNEHT